MRYYSRLKFNDGFLMRTTTFIQLATLCCAGILGCTNHQDGATAEEERAQMDPRAQQGEVRPPTASQSEAERRHAEGIETPTLVPSPGPPVKDDKSAEEKVSVMKEIMGSDEKGSPVSTSSPASH